jgi:hypothetical protein
MTAQIQKVGTDISAIKLQLFRQIDRLSLEELVEMAEYLELELEEEAVKLTPEELAEVVSFDSAEPQFVSYESLELDVEIDETEEEEVALTPEELAQVVSFEPHDGPATFQGDLDKGYAEKYADEESEREAREWMDGLIGDVTVR